MARYSFYIDGFNVYHALNDPWEYPGKQPKTRENRRYIYRKYKWINYRKLAESCIRHKDSLEGIFYFSTFVTWKPDSVFRHKVYIKALRSAKVEFIEGRFMNKVRTCPLCREKYKAHEEKQTDVNIAVKLLQDAVEDKFDKAVIVSADSDLLPVIKTVHKIAPDKEIGIMFPIKRNSFELRKACDFRFKMGEKLLKKCQFPDELKVGSTIIKRPDSWH